jgi:hypothetical protein
MQLLELAYIPRNLYAFVVFLEIPPVDTGTSPIGACQEPPVRQADQRKPARLIHGN